MIYFVLPDYYHNFKLINFLQDLNNSNPKFFKCPIHFTAASGTFPFSLWNGQYNCIDGTSYNGKYFPLQPDYTCYKHLKMPIRLNCSNACLDKDMFDDEHMNTILRLNENIGNVIEISNLNLLEYIAEKYPKYDFVFSDNADIINELNVDMINTLLSFEKFIKIKIPFRLAKDFDLLKEIKERQKIEIVVDSLCPINCPSYQKCKIDSDESQINYSEMNPFIGCMRNRNTAYNVGEAISLKEIEENYIPLGYKYFSFAPKPNKDYFENVIYYFSYFFPSDYIIKVLKIFNDQEGVFGNG